MNRLDAVGQYRHVYDPEGNLVLKFIDVDESGDLTTGDTEITEYAWDHRNRLVSVTNYDRRNSGEIPGTPYITIDPPRAFLQNWLMIRLLIVYGVLALR